MQIIRRYAYLRDYIKFADMKYVRTDVEVLKAAYAALTEKAKNAKAASAVIETVLAHEELLRDTETSSALAMIRHTIDTRDEFYTAEVEFCDNAGPLIEEAVHEFMRALIESEFRPALEKRFGSLWLDNAEMSLKCFSPEIIPELQEENKITTAYADLLASAEIEFDGKVLNISQMNVYRESPDREIRRASCEATGRYYESIGDKLDDYYDKLVKIRTEIARKLGYDSFTPVAYLRRRRNCYGPAEVKAFRDQVKSDIVPLVCRLKELQSKRIGIDDMKFWDDLYSYPEGNPMPRGTAEELLEAGRRMYTEMSPETAEFIDFMYRCELMDVMAKPGKQVGGYCTGIPSYQAPFIFSNFNGTSGDVDVLTHEAGHAFADYMNCGKELLENAQPTIEACEVHSMSMEFICWRWLELFYGEDAPKAKFRHLEDALVFLPYGCMVDEFQHIMYDKPHLTPAERHKVWSELETQYRPYLDYGDLPFYSQGRYWQRQAHIYELPFYYIDYCLAQTVALMFWAETQCDFDSAWKRYMSFVSLGGTETFTELCHAAGLPTPFDEGSLLSAVKAAEKWISDNK